MRHSIDLDQNLTFCRHLTWHIINKYWAVQILEQISLNFTDFDIFWHGERARSGTYLFITWHWHVFELVCVCIFVWFSVTILLNSAFECSDLIFHGQHWLATTILISIACISCRLCVFVLANVSTLWILCANEPGQYLFITWRFLNAFCVIFVEFRVLSRAFLSRVYLY